MRRTTTVTISHYFTGDLGQKGITEIFDEFKAKTGITVDDSPIGHEDFKTGILVRAAGHSLPDVFSYWAGARTQFVVDAGNLATDRRHVECRRSRQDRRQVGRRRRRRSMAASATLMPFGYHYAGMFYNPEGHGFAGITAMPKTWDDLVGACKTLKAKGIAAFALGSKNRWPAQFWFDYLAAAQRRAGLSRQADGGQGLLHRRRGQDGDGHVEEPRRRRLLCRQLQRQRLDRRRRPGGARATAAMTLMGTWITGYWNGNDLKPGDDYDFFEFPKIDGRRAAMRWSARSTAS